MKFKPLYFYGLVLVAAVIILVVVTQQNNVEEQLSENKISTEEMPQDDIHSQLGEGDNSPGKQNVSEEYHKKLENLRKTIEQNPNDTLAIRQYADFLAAAHQTDEAISNYNKILNINPSRIDILFNISFIYYNLGNMEKSDEYNNRVLVLQPENVSALYNKGAISATRGDTETAKEIWNRIVKEFPESETTALAKQSLERL
ncbi:MAG: tetratricopeptide repeat protein [Ignavibacteria bacterium]|nr:tetratricopeptide repeat protein [Ignavibacteria bacterium]